jgi:hypothetical protein
MIGLDQGYNGHKSVSHFYVEGIRFHLIRTHRNKNECVAAATNFIGFCINQLKMDLRVFKSDNERSLTDNFKKYYEDLGIILEFSVVGSPEQNGFMERAGGFIIAVAGALIEDAGLPKTYGQKQCARPLTSSIERLPFSQEARKESPGWRP